MGYRNDSFAAVLELERQRLGPDEECVSSWDYVWDDPDIAFNDWRDEGID